MLREILVVFHFLFNAAGHCPLLWSLDCLHALQSPAFFDPVVNVFVCLASPRSSGICFSDLYSLLDSAPTNYCLSRFLWFLVRFLAGSDWCLARSLPFLFFRLSRVTCWTSFLVWTPRRACRSFPKWGLLVALTVAKRTTSHALE